VLQRRLDSDVLTTTGTVDHNRFDTLTTQTLQEQSYVIVPEGYYRCMWIVHQTRTHGLGTGFSAMHVGKESKTWLVMHDLNERCRRRYRISQYKEPAHGL
jgi:hypothetical protein